MVYAIYAPGWTCQQIRDASQQQKFGKHIISIQHNVICHWHIKCIKVRYFNTILYCIMMEILKITGW